MASRVMETVEHGHKQAELQAERKDALCKAKKYEVQNVSISESLLHERLKR